MCGQISAAAIKRQATPASTKCRVSAIAILQSHQPKCGLAHAFGLPRNLPYRPMAAQQVMDSNRCTRRIIRIGHRTAEIAPAVAAGVSTGEGMALRVLAGE